MSIEQGAAALRESRGLVQLSKDAEVAAGAFRYNNRIRLGCDDIERTNRTLQGIVGKRLTYRTTNLWWPFMDKKPKARRDKR
jgi:hypothetical protein